MSLNNSRNIRVYPPETDVTIEQANIPGKITAVIIRSDHVSYEVTYYADFTQRIITCSENELQVKMTARKIPIGFKD
jgi:hypothetical protein